MHGLIRYGYKNEAEIIASKLTELVNRYPYLYEWYNAETGEGMGLKPFFAGAEALMAFAGSELEVSFDPYAIKDVNVPLPLLESISDDLYIKENII